MSSSANSAEIARVLATIAGALSNQASGNIQGVNIQGIIPSTASVAVSVNNPQPTIAIWAPTLPPPATNTPTAGSSNMLTR